MVGVVLTRDGVESARAAVIRLILACSGTDGWVRDEWGNGGVAQGSSRGRKEARGGIFDGEGVSGFLRWRWREEREGGGR
jgi:hypothetical protein